MFKLLFMSEGMRVTRSPVTRKTRFFKIRQNLSDDDDDAVLPPSFVLIRICCCSQSICYVSFSGGKHKRDSHVKAPIGAGNQVALHSRSHSAEMVACR